MSGEIDRATNSSIRRAIAERLSQKLDREAPMPERFRRLIDEMRRREQSGRED